MQDQLYRDIILEHWKNPQNFGMINNPDIDVEEDNPFCGDKLRLMITFKNNKVSEIKFTGEGCAISMASASLFTEELKGETVERMKKIKPQEVLDLLGLELTPARVKCALLIFSTLKKGLQVQ